MVEHDDSKTRRLEHWVHWTLLFGVTISAALLVAGLAAAAFRGAGAPREHPASPGAIVHGTTHGDPATVLLELGLIVLMATPGFRVAALAVGAMATRQPRFAAVAFTVLVLLGVSLVLGFR